MIMKRYGVILFILIIMYSCVSKTSNRLVLNDRSKQKKHADLIGFRSEFLRDFTDKEFSNSDSTLEEEKIDITNNNDTSIVCISLPWSGCANLDGDIKKVGDSVILEYWLKYDELCTELIFYKLTYKFIDKSGGWSKIGLKYLE